MMLLIERGGVIMIVIFALSVVAAAIIIERLLFFRKIRTDEGPILGRLRSTLVEGRFHEALSICESNPSPMTNLMKLGIENRSKSDEQIKNLITDAANMEVPKMERYLSSLGTIAHISPLLGLLGTVTGNIRAFGVLGGFEAAGGNPALLAQGISEALLTTAAGITVSIPAIIFYNYLVARVNHTIIRLENHVSVMVDIMQASKRARQAEGVGAR